MWTLPPGWKIAVNSHKPEILRQNTHNWKFVDIPGQPEPFTSCTGGGVLIQEIDIPQQLYNLIKDPSIMKPRYVQPITTLGNPEFWAINAKGVPFLTRERAYFNVGNAYKDEATALKASKYFAALRLRKTIPEYFKKLGNKVEYFVSARWVPITTAQISDWSKVTPSQFRAALPEWLVALGPQPERFTAGGWVKVNPSEGGDFRNEAPKNWRASTPDWYTALGPDIEFKSHVEGWVPARITDTTGLEVYINKSEWIVVRKRKELYSFDPSRFRTALPKWNKPWPRTATTNDPRGDRFVVNNTGPIGIHLESVLYGPNVHLTQVGAELQRKALKDVME